MKIAVMAEKPSLADLCLRSCARVFPDFFENDVALGFMCPYANLSEDFRYPHGLRWSDYPFSSGDPAYKKFSVSSFVGPHVIRAGTTISGIRTEDRSYRRKLLPDEGKDLEQTMVSRLREADRIFLFLDPEAGSIHVGKRAIDYLFPDGTDKAILLPEIYDMSDSTLDKAVAGGRTYAEALVYGDYIAERQRFDYLFNVNSMALLRMAVARSGGRSTYAPSKFELLFLYLLRAAGPAREGELVDAMTRWKGTGKYPSTGYTAFGAPSSRAGIIENVITARLAERDGKDIRLSPSGKSLLDFLPPACFDPDLPFRLEAWCSLLAMEARAKIERYIDMFFFKIKRKLGQPVSIEPVPEGTLTWYED